MDGGIITCSSVGYQSGSGLFVNYIKNKITTKLIAAVTEVKRAWKSSRDLFDLSFMDKFPINKTIWPFANLHLLATSITKIFSCHRTWVYRVILGIRGYLRRFPMQRNKLFELELFQLCILTVQHIPQLL